MGKAYWRVIGAALLGLTFAPTVALAEDAPAAPAQSLISFLPAPSAPADKAKLGVNVASLPSDGVTVAPPVLPATSGLYFSADGSWQHFDLPRVDLGFVNTTNGTDGTPFSSIGPTVRTNITASGYGVDLAAGYHLPPGTLSPAWGALPRVELDFSMVDASQRLSTLVVPQVGLATTGQAGAVTGLMLNGIVINNAPICGNQLGSIISCPTRSAEASDFSTWHLGLKGASEFQFGMVTATPSLSIIGGEGQNDIRLNQTQTQLANGTPVILQNYAAHTRLNWDDVGGKAGLQLKVPLANTLTAAISGSLGLVDRDASLRGSDNYTGTLFGLLPLPLPPQTSPFLSTVSNNKNTMAVLTNVEGSLTVQVTPAISLRLFGGMNYDDSVPGVRAPTYFGSSIASPGGTPARIKFVSEISYYGGAGFVVHF